jgi:putative hydroxymethylpyrimidine transport system ATP-binding protein
VTQAPAIRFAGSASHGAAPLFSRLDITLEAGRWTCLLGVSGVGKTTILRMIAGLDTGAEFNGEIVPQDGTPLAGRVAYMAQSDLLLPWATVRENIGLGARLRGESVDCARVEALIAEVGLEAHAGKKPNALSGGQKQRVALARTLMEDRAVILLDEPFSALDARTRADMQDLAHRLLAGRTVLLVTHDPGEAARLADKILVMTEAGTTEVAPPDAPAPRAVDDPAYLEAQARLFTLLRAS